jgi:LPXTG-motif cell wall-anchored protein
MNTGVPGEGDTHAFWLIMGVMAVVLVGLVYFFRKRGFL